MKKYRSLSKYIHHLCSKRDRSLSRQLLTGLGIAVVIVGYGVFWVSHELTERDLEKQVQERASSIVRSLEFATKGLIELNHTVVLQRVVQNYATLDAVEEIAILNPEGAIIAHNQTAALQQTYQDLHPELTKLWQDASKTGLETSNTTNFEGKLVLVQIMPFSSVLFGASGKRGVTIAIMDLEEMNADIHKTFWTTLAVLLLGLFAIVGLMWLLLQKLVLQPLQHLHLAVAEGGKEKFKLPYSLPNNEIGFLARTFARVFEQQAAVEQALRESETSERQKTDTLQQTLSELRQAQAQLIQTEKMSSLGQLVAGVAHEINNPVGFIHGNITHTQEYVSDLMTIVAAYQRAYPHPVAEVQDTLEEVDFEFLQEDFPRLLQSMRFGTQRIREIIISLRTFSRLDEAELKDITLRENIDSVLTILQHRLKKTASGIEVIKDYASIPPVYCYPGPLNQVFMNLLSNAIDALENHEVESPQIRIWTEKKSDRWVAISISDNGPGMSLQVKAKLFEPFFTTKPVGKGTGLGLAISYQIIVERHRGRLYCHSEIGKGTQFTIEIPTDLA